MFYHVSIPQIISYLVILAHHYILCIKQLLVLLIADIITTVQRLLTREQTNTILNIKSTYGEEAHGNECLVFTASLIIIIHSVQNI